MNHLAPIYTNPAPSVAYPIGIGVGTAAVTGLARFMFAPSPFTWKTALTAVAIGAAVGGAAFAVSRMPAYQTA